MNVALAEKIQGWMSIGELRFLAEHASRSNKIIEVGSYKGRSTRAMADNLSKEDGVIYAIDPWNAVEGYDHPRDLAAESYRLGHGNEIYWDFTANLLDYIAIKKVIPLRQQFHLTWIADADMIFIDAAHEYNFVKRDILHAIMLLPKGGFLCGHDYVDAWPDVIKVVDEIFGKGIQVFETIWWIKL